MGTRQDKFREMINLADRLKFTFSSRIKLLLAYYLPRIRARMPWVPEPVFQVAFEYQGRETYYHMRANDVDHTHLAGIFLRGDYATSLKPKRILDLGGNVGCAAVFYHACFPDAEIISVEPLPANLAVLKLNWKSNGIRGRIVEGAVFDHSGEARLHVGTVADNSTLVERDGLGKDEITVRCYTIPEIMAGAGWDSVDLMKIDVEGAEIPVFKASEAWSGKAAAIVGELHNGYGLADADRDLGYQFECSERFHFPEHELVGFYAVRKGQ